MIGRAARAVKDLLRGIKLRYPICCVLNYSLDTILGVPAGLSRGEISSPPVGTYVPCHLHKRIRSLSRTECDEFMKSGYTVERLAPNATLEMRVDGKVVSSLHIPEGLEALLLQQVRLTESRQP